ncbi:HIT family protein [Propionicicella superfundia]|uniref:HIT family protein n=1 Tax=Propionicicella superfundia TaxID=348582 RepID=UPI0004212BFE|nr:HIT family protein [Propionicicella superfundia]
MPDIVCQIARGDLAADIVLRTDDVIAFLDRRPLFKGHALVCPVAHARTLLDLPPDGAAPLLAAVQSVAAAMASAFGAEGSFVAVNNVVSQSVPHLHVHVVPRTKGDGLRGFFWPRQAYADGERAAYAGRLRAAIAGA